MDARTAISCAILILLSVPGYTQTLCDTPQNQFVLTPRELLADIPDHDDDLLGSPGVKLIASYKLELLSNGQLVGETPISRDGFTNLGGSCYRVNFDLSIPKNQALTARLIALYNGGVGSISSNESNPFGQVIPTPFGNVRIVP